MKKPYFHFCLSVPTSFSIHFLGVDNVMVYNVYEYLPVLTKMVIFVRKADSSGYFVVCLISRRNKVRI